MARPVRTGATVSIDPDPPEVSVGLIVRTSEGLTYEPQPQQDFGQFEIRMFVELDDGRRVGVGENDLVGLGTAIRDGGGWRMTITELEAEVREAIFDEEEQDEDEDDLLEEGPDFVLESEWTGVIAALAAVGVSASEDELEALPFVIELDDEVRAELAT